MFSQLPRIFGRYVLLDELAAGGMSKVYRAKAIDSRIDSLVALKRLRASAIGDAGLTTMFIDEARLTAQLVHPNIVQTYELGRDDDCLFMVMEHVWGESCVGVIAAAAKRRMVIPTALACTIALRVAEGLDFAHRARAFDGTPLALVHRDVSPHNILISYDGEVKIIDFGIAKSAISEHRTAPGLIKGKLRYLAPEQIRGGIVDARTDVYGLGLTLYELLAGEQAFDGSSSAVIFDKILEREPSALSDNIPAGLRAVVAKALAKDPAERFQSMAHFMEALTPFAMDGTALVGRQQIRTLMSSLFADAMRAATARRRHYAHVSAPDCVNFREAHTQLRLCGSPAIVDFTKTVVDKSAMEVEREAPTRVLAPRAEVAAAPTQRRRLTEHAAAPAAMLAASLLFWAWMIARVVT